MKINLNEIWNLAEIIDQGESGWLFSLHAGPVIVENLSRQGLSAIRDDPDYDPEILPSIFTFREILWQPDVFKEAKKSLPGLRILGAFCEETAATLNQSDKEVQRIYTELILGVKASCDKAVKAIESKKGSTAKVLGDFRVEVFPIVKFFVFHPKNRPDYHRDAVNRLNYAVKIMLTEFHGRYTQLKDPFWQVIYQEEKKSKKTSSSDQETPFEDEGNS